MTAIAAPAAKRVRAVYWSLSALVLLLPAIAMQLTAEVNWSWGDFAVMGTVLAIVGIGIELTLRARVAARLRALVIAAIVALFLLVWAELAVGILD